MYRVDGLVKDKGMVKDGLEAREFGHMWVSWYIRSLLDTVVLKLGIKDGARHDMHLNR